MIPDPMQAFLMANGNSAPPQAGVAAPQAGDINAMVQAAQAQQQQANQPPKMEAGVPGIVSFIKDMIHPRTDPATGRPVSRSHDFLDFMGQLLGNFAQGEANAGTGGASFGRGFGAAYQAPYTRALQNFNVQQGAQEQQARVAQQQAETQQTQLTTQLTQNRLNALKNLDISNLVPGATANEMAQLQAARAAALSTGDMGQMSRAVSEIMTQRAISGRQEKNLGAEGQAYIIPNSQSPTGFFRLQTDRKGETMGMTPVMPPPGFVGKSTTTMKEVQQADGSIQWVPVTSTTRPVIPGQGGGSNKAGGSSPRVGGGGASVGTPVQVPGLSGKPSAQFTTQMQPMASTLGMANKIFPVLNELGQQPSNLWSATEQRSAWAQYSRLGLDPANVDPNSVAASLPNINPQLAKLMPTIALMKIMGSQAFLKGIRNMRFVSQIQKHLPDPEKDTPALMLSKARALTENIPMMMADVYKSNGLTPKLDASNPMAADIAQSYLNAAGGDKNKSRIMAKKDGWQF